MDKALAYTNNRRISWSVEPEWPFPPELIKSSTVPFFGWLLPFNTNEKITCNKMNTLIENWPDRFNETSVYVLDMFKDSEDDMQDYLTRTMAVAFEGDFYIYNYIYIYIYNIIFIMIMIIMILIITTNNLFYRC